MNVLIHSRKDYQKGGFAFNEFYFELINYAQRTFDQFNLVLEVIKNNMQRIEWLHRGSSSFIEEDQKHRYEVTKKVTSEYKNTALI